jgi:hypothetical protein
MKKIADEKKGKPIEQKHMPNPGIVPFGNILEGTALSEHLTQSVF